jgi:hypothetical protein
MEKIITLTELRKLNANVVSGKITSLRMVEIINEKAFVQLCKGLEKLVKNNKDKIIGYEWHNEKTGHAIIDYDTEYRKVLTKNGYTKRPLIYKHEK